MQVEFLLHLCVLVVESHREVCALVVHRPADSSHGVVAVG